MWPNESKFLNSYAADGQLCQFKMMQKSWTYTETLANGYSSESTQWELSNEYQHDRLWIFFENRCIFVIWMNEALALKGLKGQTSTSSSYLEACNRNQQPLQISAILLMRTDSDPRLNSKYITPLTNSRESSVAFEGSSTNKRSPLLPAAAGLKRSSMMLYSMALLAPWGTSNWEDISPFMLTGCSSFPPNSKAFFSLASRSAMRASRLMRVKFVVLYELLSWFTLCWTAFIPSLYLDTAKR